MGRKNMSFKQGLLKKVFNHPLLNEFMHEYLWDLQKLKTNQKIVENFKNDFFPHLVGKKPIQINMEINLVHTLATFQFIGSYK
jgi:hypothetical protein